jgi:hypothetical protein
MKKLIITSFLLLSFSASEGIANPSRAAKGVKPLPSSAPNTKESPAPVNEEEELPEDGELPQSTPTSKYQLGLELLGAGLLYSIGGSYRLAPEWAINGGFSYYSASGRAANSTSTAEVSVKILLLPLSVSYLLGSENHYLDLFAGVTPVFASAELQLNDTASARASDSNFIPQFGLAYRYWPEQGGFHFRPALYGLVVGGKLFGWLGIQFGAAF